MSEESVNDTSPEERHVSRLELTWDVVVFQFKLVFDGIRDILLVPLSILSGILGLVAGGDEPDRYFKRVLRFGRKTEAWLNLFGHRRHGETSDKMIRPLHDKVLAGARANPWLTKAGAQLNRGLDTVNASVTGPTSVSPASPSTPTSTPTSSPASPEQNPDT